MDPREFKHDNSSARAGSAAEQIRVALTFSVSDSQKLWDAAAERGLASPGMALEDLIDVLGPREDPSIAECLALLVQPAPTPGCLLEQFDVTPARLIAAA